MWWYMPIILAFGRLKQEGHKFKIQFGLIQASLGYIARLCLKKKKINDLVNNKAHNESKVAKIVKFDLQ
jgi:hypothetical protein